jgi:hypothetical protein
MGLTIHYEMRAPADVGESDAAALVVKLRELALELPFDAVSEIVRLTEPAIAEMPRLRGFAFERLEDVAHLTAVFTREELYARLIGVERFRHEGNDVYECITVPLDVSTVACGFAIAVGPGCEPAALGALQVSLPHGAASPWEWHCFCKTQYASVHGDDNMLRCHRSLVALLDSARALGFELQVTDETGYWESRDPTLLMTSVNRMNQLMAQFAGTFTDAVRDAGLDSRGIEGEIFRHPDFERLEMGPPSDEP